MIFKSLTKTFRTVFDVAMNRTRTEVWYNRAGQMISCANIDRDLLEQCEGIIAQYYNPFVADPFSTHSRNYAAQLEVAYKDAVNIMSKTLKDCEVLKGGSDYRLLLSGQTIAFSEILKGVQPKTQSSELKNSKIISSFSSMIKSLI